MARPARPRFANLPRFRQPFAIAIFAIVLPLLPLLLTLAPASAATYPVAHSLLEGAQYAFAHPGSAPPGAISHRRAAHHQPIPHPVVLVHGTFANMADNWAGLAPTLANDGYCVFALTYGDRRARSEQRFGADVLPGKPG